MADKPTPSADDLIEIPSDEIQLGHDADGLPKVVAGTASATGKPIEEEGEDRKPKTRVITAAELETEQERSAKLQRERDELARQAETERQARIQAESERDTRTSEAFGAHRARVYAEMQTIDSGISQTENLLNALKGDLKAAHEAGDMDRVSAIIGEQATANATLSTLRQAKPEIEAQVQKADRIAQSMASAPPKKEEPPPAPRAPSRDEFIDTARKVGGERFADWLHENPKYADPTNKENRKLVRFADEWAEDNGQESLRTKAFRDAVEAKFAPPKQEEREPEVVENEGNDEPEVVAEKPRAKKVAAAPVGRANDVFSSQSPNARKMRAPPDIVAFCRQSGLNLEQYMLAARDEIRKGDKPKEWLDPDYDRGIR